jgi:L-threonylcarbamoyladenylate synthase
MTDDLNSACDVLRKGGLILYPTDTVWGIGCDATSTQAVQRIYALKQRADHKAMIVLIDSAARLDAYVTEIPPVARDLAEAADKPLTIIYPNARNIAPALLGEDGSVGIRITNERFSHNLCERFRKPVVSTSANISGQPAPASFAEIAEAIRLGVDYVVRYRQEEVNRAKPSGIIRIDGHGRIRIIRQ